MAHTPGPWGWHKVGSDTFLTDDRLGRHMAKLLSGTPDRDEDARLIAAAPQLLEGAIDAREAILNERFSLSEAGLTSDQINAVLDVFDDFLAAAIAKAEGR